MGSRGSFLGGLSHRCASLIGGDDIPKSLWTEALLFDGSRGSLRTGRQSEVAIALFSKLLLLYECAESVVDKVFAAPDSASIKGLGNLSRQDTRRTAGLYY